MKSTASTPKITGFIFVSKYLVKKYGYQGALDRMFQMVENGDKRVKPKHFKV